VGAGQSSRTAQAGHGTQLVQQRLALGLGAGESPGVVVALRFGDVLIEVAEALSIAGQCGSVDHRDRCAALDWRSGEVSTWTSTPGGLSNVARSRSPLLSGTLADSFRNVISHRPER
jgi:hypothetical protein